MGTNFCLEELIQRLILRHPKLETSVIAGKLWGEDKLESKRKKLCRKCNPDDHGAHFSPNELPRLLEILNEGLSPEERAEKGGDAVIHYLSRRLGLITHALGDASRQSQGAGKIIADYFKSTGKLINNLASAVESESPLSSAVTFKILDDGYKVQAKISEMMAWFTSQAPR